MDSRVRGNDGTLVTGWRRRGGQLGAAYAGRGVQHFEIVPRQQDLARQRQTLSVEVGADRQLQLVRVAMNEIVHELRVNRLAAGEALEHGPVDADAHRLA